MLMSLWDHAELVCAVQEYSCPAMGLHGNETSAARRTSYSVFFCLFRTWSYARGNPGDWRNRLAVSSFVHKIVLIIKMLLLSPPIWHAPFSCRLPTDVQAEAIPLILGGGDVLMVRGIPMKLIFCRHLWDSYKCHDERSCHLFVARMRTRVTVVSLSLCLYVYLSVLTLVPA